MALGYRAILRLPDDQTAVKVAEDQIRSWLRTKFKSAAKVLDQLDWDNSGVYYLAPKASVTVVTLRDQRDHSVRQLIRFDETNPTGRWIVSVWAISLPLARANKQTLVIEVDRPGGSVDDALRDAKPPRLIRHILDSTSVRDSSTILTATPTIIRSDNLSSVVAAILDPGRIASVVVAVSPGQVSDERWKEVIGQLSSDSVGVSTAFVIAESAIDLFEEQFPSSHRVPRGGVRTFAPKVDLDDPSDGVRHRTLGAATFVRSIREGRVGGSLPAIHAQRARRRLVEVELPSDTRRALEMIVREESSVIRAARVSEMAQPVVEAAPGLAKEPFKAPAKVSEWVRAGISKLGRWIGRSEFTPELIDDLERFIATTADGYTVATQQIDSLLVEQNRLQVELERVREQAEVAQLEAGLEEESAREATRETRILRQRLRDSQQFDSLFIEPEKDAWKPPQDFEELILRLTTVEKGNPVASRVIFCGDESTALEIDKRDSVGRYVARMWEYTLVLHDFAEARGSGFEGSVHQYLSDSSVSGRKCSPQRHAAGESETVTSNSRMLKERSFAVPLDVDASGRATMLAHFKPTHTDTFAPRLYYMDDTALSGKIYIGYIGRHLANTRTN